MKRITCIILLSLLWLISASLYTPETSAQTATCSLTPQSGRVLVQFNKKIRADQNQPQSEVGPVNTTLNAGTYRVTVVSYDAHSLEPLKTQAHEQWFMELLSVDYDLVATTPTSSDIPDNQDYRTDVIASSLTVPLNVGKILAIHTYYPDPEAHSVIPVCAAFDLTTPAAPSIPSPTPLTGTPASTVMPPATNTISGNVFFDLNANGIKDSSEQNIQGARIQLSDTAFRTSTTNFDGNYIFSTLKTGTYTVRIQPPTGYKATTQNPQRVSVGPDKQVNFGLNNSYTITGSIFNDTNKNRIIDEAEQIYTGNAVISSTGGNSTVDNGTYLIANLSAGVNTVSFTSLLPAGFQMIYPQNGPPPSFTVIVGPACTVDGTTGAECNISGDITNLNFAITDSIPWIQGQGMDMRFDKGITNYIPPKPVCSGPYASIPGSSASPGILFTGDRTANFGSGKPSSDGWLVGGSNYPETLKTNSQRSTSYTVTLANVNKAGASISNLSAYCNLADCTLPGNLDSGVYRVNGNIKLNGHRFKNNGEYIFLINGTLSINGNIEVPRGSSAFFTAAQDIIISSSVGSSPACNAQSNLQGLFSSDRNFTVQGINNCINGADKMLKIEGAVFVNAAINGGNFVNNRDLCSNNFNYPSIMFIERADFILNTPNIFMRKGLIFREEAP